jgi:hypothetical protein
MIMFSVDFVKKITFFIAFGEKGWYKRFRYPQEVPRYGQLDLWHNISGCGNGRDPVDAVDLEPTHDGPEARLSIPKRGNGEEMILSRLLKNVQMQGSRNPEE